MIPIYVYLDCRGTLVQHRPRQSVIAKPEIIWQTVSDIRAMKPDYIAPVHCTGFDAMVAFGQEMPEAFHLNMAGTRYTFYSGISMPGLAGQTMP